MLNSHMRCYVTQWSVTSLVAWVCAATLSPRKFGSPVKIALWPFLFSKLLDVSAVFWSFRCIFKSKILCKQSHPIKSKGQNIKCRCYHVGNFSTMASALYRENSTCISSQEVKLQVKLQWKKKTSSDCSHRVRTLFWTKTSRTFQGLSRTHFAFFKDSIQCKKEIWVYVFFSSTTTWAILSWRSFILGTWESGLDKVSTEIQGLSSTDCNFPGLSRPWTFYFKFQGLSRNFKVRANPV